MLPCQFQTKNKGTKADLEMLHSFLLLQDPGPFIGRTLDTIRHTSEDDLRDLEA